MKKFNTLEIISNPRHSYILKGYLWGDMDEDPDMLSIEATNKEYPESYFYYI